MPFVIKSASKFVFLLIGLFILFLSFLSANTIFSQGKSLQLTQKTMYLNREVLPDHILYPVFMLFDKGRLFFAKDEEKSQLNISYGWQRLGATEELLKRGYQSLSFSTLTKACKYQNSGLIEAKDLSTEDKQKIVFQATQFSHQVNNLKSSFADEQQLELTNLLQEQAFLLSNLQ